MRRVLRAVRAKRQRRRRSSSELGGVAMTYCRAVAMRDSMFFVFFGEMTAQKSHKKATYAAIVDQYRAQWYAYVASLGVMLPPDHDEALFARTFVHKSFAADYPHDQPDNERLEFIGDAVLGAIIAKQLFEEFPTMSEAALTMRKIALVRTETLADVSRRLQLGEQLLLSVGEEKAHGRTKDKLLADVCEALIGMQYVICGYDQAKAFVLEQLYAYKDDIFATMTIKSYKSQFQERVQKTYGDVPTYDDEVIAHDEYGNVSCFRSTAVHGERRFGTGE